MYNAEVAAKILEFTLKLWPSIGPDGMGVTECLKN